MNFVPTEKVILTINAYDVDEERGERDIIYLHDMTSGSARQPIYCPGSSTLYYLRGVNQTWSTSSFEIDPSKFVMGHLYWIELRDSVSGWYVWIRQLTMEVQQQSIQFNSMNASIDASGNVNVQSSISASKTLASSLIMSTWRIAEATLTAPRASRSATPAPSQLTIHSS